MHKTLPMTREDACAKYGDMLSAYELDEIEHFPFVYYLNPARVEDFDCSNKKKFNHDYDYEGGIYIIKIGDHIKYRYEIKKKLGNGSFGVVVGCFDHKEKEEVAIKILKNDLDGHEQGKREIDFLRVLRDSDPEGINNIVIYKDGFDFRNHVVITCSYLCIVHLMRNVVYRYAFSN